MAIMLRVYMWYLRMWCWRSTEHLGWCRHGVGFEDSPVEPRLRDIVGAHPHISCSAITPSNPSGYKWCQRSAAIMIVVVGGLFPRYRFLPRCACHLPCVCVCVAVWPFVVPLCTIYHTLYPMSTPQFTPFCGCNIVLLRYRLYTAYGSRMVRLRWCAVWCDGHHCIYGWGVAIVCRACARVCANVRR